MDKTPEVSLLESLSKFTNKFETRKINDRNILIIGELPSNSESLIASLSKYTRLGGDCFEATEHELETQQATGCYVNTILPRHALPAREVGDFVIAYDDPGSIVDCVMF